MQTDGGATRAGWSQRGCVEPQAQEDGLAPSGVDYPVLFRPLLPEAIHLAEVDPCLVDPDTLHPEERYAVAGAVDSRRREFAAGRFLARDLLARLGDLGPVLRDADRSPRWPASVVGSITHCEGCCAVALAPAAAVGMVGIDVEPAQPLPAEVVRMVLSTGEIASFARLPGALRRVADRVVFSAKESSYKAIYPSTRRLLDFDAMHVDLTGEGGFVATLLIDAPPFRVGSRLHGRYRVTGQFIATAMYRHIGDMPQVWPAAPPTKRGSIDPTGGSEW